MSFPASLTTIAICQIIFAVAMVVVAAAVVYGVFAFKKMISKKLDEVMCRVQPVVDQAKSIAEQARDTTEKVSGRVDSIMSKAEDTAERVTEKVQSVSSKVDESEVGPQVAAVAGIAGAALNICHAFQEMKKVKARRRKVVRADPDTDADMHI